MGAETRGRSQLIPDRRSDFFPANFYPRAARTASAAHRCHGSPGGSELTYRIIVEELPPLSAVTKQTGAHVSFRLRLSVPVYVRPAHAVAQGVVRSATVRGSKIRVVIANEGNAHFVASKATLTARRADGSTIFSNASSSWFVLANAEHELEIAVPAKTCAEIRSVDVRVTGDGTSFGRTIGSILPNCSK